jgi:KDO2-lipid IV(A) lauroyltransferase
MKGLSQRILPAVFHGLGKLPLPLMRSVGDGIGRFSYWRRNRMARVTRRNIERCFPECTLEQQRALEKASLQETGRLAGETFVVWSRPYDWVRRHVVQIHGLDRVKAQLAEGKGLIVLAPHIGNWEVLGLYLSELGPVTSLYEPPKNPQVEHLVRHAREASGATLVPTNRKGVVALFQALQNGHISGILPDQTPNDAGGRFSEFFGQPTFTMTLVHKLIQKTGCRAVFGYAKRVPKGWEIVFNPVAEELYGNDEKIALRALNQGIEACVQDVPEQYQWEYKRFKKQPDKSYNFYEGTG